MDDSPPTRIYYSPSPVVVQLNTIFTITAAVPSGQPDFKSVYQLLDDGSLVAPSFFNDLSSTYLALVIMASLFTVFARNITLSATFLWSGRVRKKSLLYTLFLSQLLAPVSILPLLISQFHPSFNCKLFVNSISFQMLTSN
jgi:hypothetical protein